MDESRVPAKKVFFLYPHSVIQETLLNVLVQAEFEVALLNDYQKASSVLYKYPNSVLFINIEANLPPAEWEGYIRSLMNSRQKHGALIGILTYNPSPELAEKYLMDIGVQCGFIGLKLNLAESAKIILKTLDANEARGGRKFVRVKCNQTKTSININYGNRLIQGDLLDISSAGCAAVLEGKYPPGTVFDDIQLKLWGALVKVKGSVMGTRTIDEAHEVHVIMFDENLDRAIKGKIYTFIQKTIQVEVDSI